MKKIIIPAIIAKTQNELDGILAKIGDKATLLQLDVMDGRFVPSTSLDFDFKILKWKYLYEAHLMIEEPEEWVEKNRKKVETAIAHIEAVKDLGKMITTVKSMGKKVGLALNPETPINTIKDFLDEIDQVLIMTVHPGFYGSKFLPEMAGKIQSLRNLCPELNIEVDGGISPNTIDLVNEAGANMFVSGSYLLRAENFQENMNFLKEKVGAR